MVKTEPFEPERYLTTPDAQEDLLNDALATGHAGYVAHALGVIARARGMTEVTCGTLHKSLSEADDLRLSTLLDVARALGVTFTVRITPQENEPS